MPADATRIGFIIEEFRKVVSEDASVRSAYGNVARETDDPVETFFDNEDDAQVMADERLALLGVIGRRRFRLEVAGTQDVAALDYAGGQIPNAWLTSEQHNIDRKMVVAEIGYDFGKQDSAMMVWG